jgi:hypothetical protein
VSDTPRTDSRLTAILDADGFVDHSNCPQRWVNHSRELERELNAANERIKRLEEAGDELLDWIGSDVSDANRKLIIDSWHKAKEAKP